MDECVSVVLECRGGVPQRASQHYKLPYQSLDTTLFV